MKINNEFNPDRLRFARKRRGITIRALSSNVGLSSKSLSDYENGRSIPPDQTLSALARELRFPIAFFFLESISPINDDAVSFRSLSRTPASVRDSVLAAGEIALEFSSWLDEHFETPRPDLLDLQDFHPEAAAVALRDHWAIGEKPVRNMVHLLEAKGVRVFSLVENTYDVDACSFWINRRPFVFLNTKKSVERSRFDAAHELGHLVLHRHGTSRGKEAEFEANRFASAFLMPEGSVLSRINSFITLDHIIHLKPFWLVSAAALVRRLKDLNLISEWQYRTLTIELSKNGYMKTEPNPINERETSKLLPMVFKALREEGITKHEIASSLSIDPSEIDSLIFNLSLSTLDGGRKGAEISGTKNNNHLRVIK